MDVLRWFHACAWFRETYSILPASPAYHPARCLQSLRTAMLADCQWVSTLSVHAIATRRIVEVAEYLRERLSSRSSYQRTCVWRIEHAQHIMPPIFHDLQTGVIDFLEAFTAFRCSVCDCPPGAVRSERRRLCLQKLRKSGRWLPCAPDSPVEDVSAIASDYPP